MTMRIPDFTLPAQLGRFGARLPQLPPSLALVAALNLALDRILPRGPLVPLDGRRLAIRITDAGIVTRFKLSGRHFTPVFDGSPADLTISARTRDYLARICDAGGGHGGIMTRCSSAGAWSWKAIPNSVCWSRIRSMRSSCRNRMYRLFCRIA